MELTQSQVLEEGGEVRVRETVHVGSRRGRDVSIRTIESLYANGHRSVVTATTDAVTRNVTVEATNYPAPVRAAATEDGSPVGDGDEPALGGGDEGTVGRPPAQAAPAMKDSNLAGDAVPEVHLPAPRRSPFDDSQVQSRERWERKLSKYPAKKKRQQKKQQTPPGSGADSPLPGPAVTTQPGAMNVPGRSLEPGQNTDPPYNSSAQMTIQLSDRTSIADSPLITNAVPVDVDTDDQQESDDEAPGPVIEASIMPPNRFRWRMCVQDHRLMCLVCVTMIAIIGLSLGLALPLSSSSSSPDTASLPTTPDSGATLRPSQMPSFGPSFEDLPSPLPSSPPSPIPSSSTTSGPSSLPTSHPSPVPTVLPTSLPTSSPTQPPSSSPTSPPSLLPTALPTSLPTSTPTQPPSSSPTARPSSSPSNPTPIPTSTPTLPPTCPSCKQIVITGIYPDPDGDGSDAEYRLWVTPSGRSKTALGYWEEAGSRWHAKSITNMVMTKLGPGVSVLFDITEYDSGGIFDPDDNYSRSISGNEWYRDQCSPYVQDYCIQEGGGTGCGDFRLRCQFLPDEC